MFHYYEPSELGYILHKKANFGYNAKKSNETFWMIFKHCDLHLHRVSQVFKFLRRKTGAWWLLLLLSRRPGYDE